MLGARVLARCRDDVAAYQRDVCAEAPTDWVREQCESALAPGAAPRASSASTWRALDRRLGNFSDGRLRMVWPVTPRARRRGRAARPSRARRVRQRRRAAPGVSSFWVQVVQVNGEAPPPPRAPLPANRGDTVDTWSFRIEARDAAGRRTAFDGMVRLSVDPGAVLGVEADDESIAEVGRNIRLRDGGVAEGTAHVTAGLARPIRLWSRTSATGLRPGATARVRQRRQRRRAGATCSSISRRSRVRLLADDDTEEGGFFSGGVLEAGRLRCRRASPTCRAAARRRLYRRGCGWIDTAAPQQVVVTRVSAARCDLASPIWPARAAASTTSAYSAHLPTPRSRSARGYLAGTVDEFFGFTQLSFLRAGW